MVPATGRALHQDTRARILELERRLGRRPDDVDFMVCATTNQANATEGAEGSGWWRPPGRCAIWGLHLSRTSTGEVLTVSFGADVTCTLGATDSAGFATAVPTADGLVRRSPDDVCRFLIEAGSTVSGIVVMQALLWGEQPGSAGLRFAPVVDA